MVNCSNHVKLCTATHALKVLNADFIRSKGKWLFPAYNVCIIASPNKSHACHDFIAAAVVVAAVGMALSVFIVATIFNSYYFKLSSLNSDFLLLWQWDEKEKLSNPDEKKTIKNCLYAGDINLNTWNTNFQLKNCSYVLARLATEAPRCYRIHVYFYRFSIGTTMATKWIRQ